MRIIRTAIDEGINFLDNAWCYHKGESERMMGRALRGGYRAKVFLMTKNHGRDGETYTRQLEESLERLRTDMIDLVQFHEVIDEGVPNMIFGQGVIEAALKAKEAGKIRFIGFTGHKDAAHLMKMLAKPFHWASVQMPLNLLDAHFRSFQKKVVPECTKRKIGVIGMKSLSSGRIPKELKNLYATAFEVEPRWLVDAASRRQKWLDQAQSLNLYMSEPSGAKLDTLYKLAWVRGLKTTYYLRSMGATHGAAAANNRNIVRTMKEKIATLSRLKL